MVTTCYTSPTETKDMDTHTDTNTPIGKRRRIDDEAQKLDQNALCKRGILILSSSRRILNNKSLRLIEQESVLKDINTFVLDVTLPILKHWNDTLVQHGKSPSIRFSPKLYNLTTAIIRTPICNANTFRSILENIENNMNQIAKYVIHSFMINNHYLETKEFIDHVIELFTNVEPIFRMHEMLYMCANTKHNFSCAVKNNRSIFHLKLIESLSKHEIVHKQVSKFIGIYRSNTGLELNTLFKLFKFVDATNIDPEQLMFKDKSFDLLYKCKDQIILDIQNHYREVIQHWIDQVDIFTYTRNCYELIEQEKQVFCPISERMWSSTIRDEIHTMLFQDKLGELLKHKVRGIVSLIHKKEYSQVYTVFENTNQLHMVDIIHRSIFEEFTQHSFQPLRNEYITVGKREKGKNKFSFKLISSYLDHYTYLNTIVQECYRNDKHMEKIILDQFSKLINIQSYGIQEDEYYCPSELMASCLDEMLKKKMASMDELQISTFFNNMHVLFKQLTDKDMFLLYHKQHMAHRILDKKGDALTEMMEYEKTFISLLKGTMGSNFTSHCETMIRDVNKHDEKEFKTIWSNSENRMGCIVDQFDTTIIQSGAWPSLPLYDVHLPKSLEQAIHVFENIYRAKESSKRLNWVFSCGSAKVKVNFDDTRWKMIEGLNSMQLFVLMLFNDTDSLSMEEIGSKLNLDKNTVKRITHPLFFEKTKRPILKKKDDILTFNQKLVKYPKKRLNYPIPIYADHKVRTNVHENRKFTVDAAVVRIMKSRKLLSHPQLISEVLKQLTNFRPDIKLIKGRIEDLVEREFLERCKGDDDEVDGAFQGRGYRYLA